MTIGPSGSPNPSLDARTTTARSAPAEPVEEQPTAPGCGDDVVQVGAFKALVGDYTLVPPSHRGGVPVVVIPAVQSLPGAREHSHTARMMVGGTFAGAMGGAFVAASFASASPVVGMGILLGSTALGAAMGFLASRREPSPPGGQALPPA